MAEILPFKKPSKTPSHNNSLCKNGHHKWKVDKAKQFDVKQGKLVTLYVCEKCGQKKSQLT